MRLRIAGCALSLVFKLSRNEAMGLTSARKVAQLIALSRVITDVDISDCDWGPDALKVIVQHIGRH